MIMIRLRGGRRGCFGWPHFRNLPYRTGHVISSGAVRRWSFPRQEGQTPVFDRPGFAGQGSGPRQGDQAGAFPARASFP